MSSSSEEMGYQAKATCHARPNSSGPRNYLLVLNVLNGAKRLNNLNTQSYVLGVLH